jgi:hypothetical protein
MLRLSLITDQHLESTDENENSITKEKFYLARVIANIP